MGKIEQYKEIAKKYDLSDKLSHFKERFDNSNDSIYLVGNSLGKLPLDTINNVNQTVKMDWGKGLISSWNQKWLSIENTISKKISKILKCNEDEIYVGASTSENLYKLLKSILINNLEINSIISDNLNFPSDIYIAEGISKDFENIRFKLLDYGNEAEANIDKLKEFISKNNGILILSLVSYKSSYRYPIKEINDYCENNNSIVIWDISHAIGAIDIDFHNTNTKYAVGCTYKYLNGGPGSPAFIYVNEKDQNILKTPIRGWFSHNSPFDFSNNYEESNSMSRFKSGSPNIIQLSALEKGLDIILEAGTIKLEKKSIELFNLFKKIFNSHLSEKGYNLITPTKDSDRGSHITISHKESWRISKCLNIPKNKDRKILVDFRPNQFIRISLTPLYTSFEDIYNLTNRLSNIVEEKEYMDHDYDKPNIT
jgi:kynureninase|tara:strand:- start:35019 stop:36296 length:1278 start_codon:yes stop_codon:yes gene_type:complete